MKKLLASSALLGLLAVQGCMAPKVGSPEAKALVVKEIQEQKAEAADDIVSNIPSWCTDLPKSNVAIHSCGIGNSSDLNLARSRALLDAKRQIADQIDSEISALMDDFMDTIGTDANEQVRQETQVVTRNVIANAKLSGYVQKETETQNIGTKYQHYILMEYPIGDANTALMSQLQKNETLNTQRAADKALAELEAEINKRKNN
jgi:hypothetical protein